MKRIISRVIKCLALIGVSILVIGCSPAKKDHEIVTDIEEQFEDDFSYVQFDKIEGSLEQRQTNKDEKTDYAWVKIYAENDLVELQCIYEVTYVLYNDGWKLEESEVEDSTLKVLKSTVTEEDAEEQIEANYSGIYDEIWLNDRNTELSGAFGSDVFEYVATYEDGYMKKYDVIDVEFAFYGLSEGWKFQDAEKNEWYEEWDVLGKWTYSSDENNVEIIFHEINNNEILLEYDFRYKHHVFLKGDQIEKLSSGGIDTREKLNFGWDGDIGCYIRGDYDEYIRISTDGVTFGRHGDSSIEYQLTYQGK